MKKLIKRIRKWRIRKLEERIAPTTTLCINPLGQADLDPHCVTANDHAAAAHGHGAVSPPPDPGGGDMRLYFTGDLGRMGADGCLDYLGRKDFQAKLRGQWCNPAKI